MQPVFGAIRTALFLGVLFGPWDLLPTATLGEICTWGVLGIFRLPFKG